MFPISAHSIIRRISCFFIFVLLLTLSCKKDDLINNFSPVVSFDITGRLLEGKHIDCLATDNKGNVFIASNKELYFTNKNVNKSYSLDFPILSLAIAPDETVWIGTNGGGLGHLTKNGFAWYTSANAGLPRDYVRNVKIAPDGNVWFSSCANELGGLGVFDGEKFEFLTPENSPLNYNIIDDIEIGQDGKVYIATAGKVGKSNIYRIVDKSWDCLGDEKGTFYWVFSFAVSPSGLLYVVEDFSLSSSSYNSSNKLFEFRNNTWQRIETDFMPGIDFFTRIKSDKRNYCWLTGFGDNSFTLHVYNGKSWLSSPEGIFPDDFITTLEIDNDNNIWVGTYKNGVFILNQ